MKRFTLEEIGKIAGVSRATVSRVINNHPNISDSVRQRVLDVIEETGYHRRDAEIEALIGPSQEKQKKWSEEW